jgi:L-fuculose-phosphate aldolase
MTPFKEVKRELIKIGRLTFEGGLTDSHGGNLSCRVADYLIIKRSGAMLGSLKEEDFIVTTVEENPMLDKFASLELIVHRAIYKQLPQVKAILHAHAPYTVACSLKWDEIIPLDSEGQLLFKKAPVLKAKEVVSSEEVARKLPQLLKKFPVAVVHSHGPFAVGRTPEEALKFLSALENSCKILAAYSQLNGSK